MGSLLLARLVPTLAKYSFKVFGTRDGSVYYLGLLVSFSFHGICYGCLIIHLFFVRFFSFSLKLKL